MSVSPAFVCVFVSCFYLFISSVSLPGDDVLCYGFFLRLCLAPVWFDLVLIMYIKYYLMATAGLLLL